MSSKFAVTISVLAATLLCSGCSSTPKGVEARFGDSVRSVMENQTYDKNAAANPSSIPVTGGNPDRIDAVVEGHAGDVSNAAAVSQPIRVGVGQQ
jgi:hypothetical protein